MFEKFKMEMQLHFQQMARGKTKLFVANVDKDELWNLYLDSFPPGTNEIFRERREHDCSCCRSFIRAMGAVVAIADDYELVSIWDFQPAEDKFSVVCAAMSAYVKSTIGNVLVTKDSAIGTDFNIEELAGGTMHTWHHFRIDLPRRFIYQGARSTGDEMNEHRVSKQMLKRGFDELTKASVTTVLDMIAEDGLYRGEENQGKLEQFLGLHDKYHTLADDKRDNFCWLESTRVGGSVARIHGSAIGTLLIDISNGVSLESAVAKYKHVADPRNYQRTTKSHTTSQVDRAEQFVRENGLEDSLGRRFAVLGDIRINNVLWADRDAEAHMDGASGLFQMLRQEVSVKPESFKHVQGIGIEDFVANVLPSAKKLEVLFENRHRGNLVSLIAPQVADAKGILKWGNPFSWNYAGDLADSMKARVKAAGGDIDGVLRFSIQWNTGTFNPNDFDAHCIEPSSNHIYYPTAGYTHQSGGILDVDIMNPKRNIPAVENITWGSLSRMPEGTYRFFVHNYSHNGGRTGFDAQVEFGGKIFAFSCDRELKREEKVDVAYVTLRDGKFGIHQTCLPTTINGSKEVWGIGTNQFQPVSTFMFSPNHWDGEGVGNRHYFWMIAGCEASTARGFFNEYLHQDFRQHRYVFEALGARMQVAPSPDQLSGLGFSTTKRDSLIVRVDGQIQKIVF